ncbi:MAG: hypothetical protein IKJ11_10380 [Clostridia bacterium]|nr:hypothetical protein [Clostridia bacterium]
MIIGILAAMIVIGIAAQERLCASLVWCVKTVKRAWSAISTSLRPRPAGQSQEESAIVSWERKIDDDLIHAAAEKTG